MQLHKFTDASQFYDRVKDYLLSHESEHCLLFGVINTLVHNPERYNCEPYLATVENNENIIAVAIKTPPFPLLLSKTQDFQAVELFVRDLYSLDESLPGVNSFTREGQSFAETWQIIANQSYQVEMEMRIHSLDKVLPIAQSIGHLRPATESDRDLLVQWCEAFGIEAASSADRFNEHFVDNYLQQKNFYIWQNQVPVSMACAKVSTPNGALIGPVYTPPEYRQKGYASSCVATLSKTLLDQGYKYCFLFTNLANPTSNHIYREIGYQPVADWNNIKFI
jgi:uncharacterized protein